MSKDKYIATRNKWQRENKRSYTMRCSRVSEQKLIDYMERHTPSNAFLKELVTERMEKEAEE